MNHAQNEKPDILSAIEPVVDTFELIGIPYFIGGSVASSAYGIARATLDIDVIAEIKNQHTVPLVKSLETQYYVSLEAVNGAIKRESSFNLIHLETLIKVDIFILKSREYDRGTLKRKRSDELDKAFPRKYYISSPEDIILNKLVWFKKGDESSDQQWKDILGVFKVQQNNMEYKYLSIWADKLGVSILLERAFNDAGIINELENNDQK